jgi:hypothetical protein
MYWTITAYPWSNPLESIELRTATSRSFTMRLRAPHSAQFTISGDEPDTLSIEELMTDILITCKDGDEVPEICFQGRCGNTQDTLSEDVHAIAYNFVDYKWILDRRLHEAETEYGVGDIHGHAYNMINDAQFETNGSMGISDTGIPTVITKQYSHDVGDSIFDKIDDIYDTDPRAEWDFLPTYQNQRYFTSWMKRGKSASISGEILEYGKTVSAMTRSRVAADFANYLIATGGEGTVPATLASADLATDPRGRFEKVFNFSNVKEQQTLVDHLDALMPVVNEINSAYNVTLRQGWWRGPRHIWLGDVITLMARHGRMDVDQYMRVVEISVALDDDGEETVRMVLIPDDDA